VPTSLDTARPRRSQDFSPGARRLAHTAPRPSWGEPRCAECEALWLPADEERWCAYLGSDDLDELPELVFYCPDCAERAFKS
jgi:hypothetical protein